MNTSFLGSIDDEVSLKGPRRFELNVEGHPTNAIQWIEDNSTAIMRVFEKHGAALIRGLEIQGSKKLEAALTTIFRQELLEYFYRSTPRTRMRGNIYTSSEYHPSEAIALHNENAYSNKWPMRIAFYCVQPSETGGETPIADSRLVYGSIPRDVRTEFETRRLLYVRNFGDIDLPWTEVFQTNDRTDVERYCRENGIEYEWLTQGRLRTKEVANAAYLHPETHEKVWFNQAHMFHISNVNAETRESMLRILDIDELPRNVYFADGATIEDEKLESIRQAYNKNTETFSWNAGDLLLLDNMLFAHGRRPYSGSRKVLVGMCGAMDSRSPVLTPIRGEM